MTFAGLLPAALAGVGLTLLGGACASDLRTRRIPNTVVVAITLLGIAFSIATRPWFSGVTNALGGIAVGLTLWLPFYAWRMVGAGDVKLFAACAAWLGPSGAVEAAVLTALAGGLVALVAMTIDRGVSATLFRLVHAVREPAMLRAGPVSRFRRMPYALAISGGVIAAAWLPGILW